MQQCNQQNRVNCPAKPAPAAESDRSLALDRYVSGAASRPVPAYVHTLQELNSMNMNDWPVALLERTGTRTQRKNSR
jgi:hypothetical protein